MASENNRSVAIVILNYNGRNYLEEFLPGVIANSPGCQVIVADNASTDDSVALLRTNFPAVEVITLPENYGFCEGYNQALKQVTAKYYVLLNSDVQVTPGWVEPILNLMENNRQIAACQPKIKAFNDPQYFEYAGAAGGFLDRYGYPFCRGRLFDHLETDEGQYNDNREIFWATGACMFVRADLFKQHKGLEPAFFAHMEEIDLCWRLQNAGYKIYVCGQSEVYHVGGGTLHKSNPRKTFLNYRNGLALLVKNIPDQEFYETLFIRILLDWVSALKFFLSGQLEDGKAVFRAHKAVYDKRYYWQKQRQGQPAKRRLTELSGVYNGSLVWAYFAEGKRKFTQLFFGK